MKRSRDERIQIIVNALIELGVPSEVAKKNAYKFLQYDTRHDAHVTYDKESKSIKIHIRK